MEPNKDPNNGETYIDDGEAEVSEETEADRPPKKKPRPQSSPKGGGKKKRRRKKKSKAGWIVLILLLALLGGGAYYFYNTYLFVGGQLYRRDTSELDFRGTAVSREAYENVVQQLPDATIRWDVPLSGGACDCEAESIALRAWDEGDYDLLGYFTGLSAVDLTAAELSPDQYERLAAALPEAEIRWSVPVGGSRYPSDSRSVTLQSLSAADLPMFAYFDALESVDARACRDYEAIMALRDEYPAVDLSWQVTLSGTDYLQDAEAISVDDPAISAAQLDEALEYLPAVKSVDAPVNTWTLEEKAALLEKWPEIAFRWPVTIAGTVYYGDETAIDLSGKKLSSADVDDLIEFGPYLSELAAVDLSGTDVSVEDALRIKEALPETELKLELDVCGVKVTSEDTFLDLTGVKMDSTEELERVLPLLPKLEKVDMTDCGFSDEEMDELNKRNEAVRFVWTMYINHYTIRTDDRGFIGSLEHYGYFDAKLIRKFIYCEDMICLDLGHRITFNDLTFLYEMPQVVYLVLADCRTTDITPIGSLKNLIFLEMILAYAKDLRPLKDCTSLVDLNVSFCTRTDQEQNYEAFVSLSGQLKRLWYSSYMIAKNKQEQLKKEMPNTDVHITTYIEEATGQRWRYSKNYYDMRDILGMWYMGDLGGRQMSRYIDGVEYPLDKDFLAKQYYPYH